MASIMAMKVTRRRKKDFMSQVRVRDRLRRLGLRSAARGSTREYTSRVETMGAALLKLSEFIDAEAHDANRTTY